jgi:DNA-binding transcriptional LysR family regulator
MELRRLKYFKVLAEELHFMKASKILFITQPTLSNQIEQLEVELGVDLFSKSKRKIERKVELTQAGIELLPLVKILLQKADEIKSKMSKYHENSTTISVGVYNVSLKQIVPRLLQLINEEDGQAKIKVIEYKNSLEVVDNIKAGKIDLGLALNIKENNQLVCKEINHGYLTVIMHKSNPLCSIKNISIADLCTQKWVEISKEVHPFIKEINALFTQIKYNRKKDIVQEVSNLDLLCNMVNNKIGIAFINSQFDISQYKNIVQRKIFDGSTKKNEVIPISNVVVARRNSKSIIVKTLMDKL